jgi:hypothetical protein
MAARCQAAYPSAMKCLTTDREGLTAYLRFPAEHNNRVRDSDFIERTFGETRRRVKVIGRLPGETSCLILVWAVLDRASPWLARLHRDRRRVQVMRRAFSARIGAVARSTPLSRYVAVTRRTLRINIAALWRIFPFEGLPEASPVMQIPYCILFGTLLSKKIAPQYFTARRLLHPRKPLGHLFLENHETYSVIHAACFLKISLQSVRRSGRYG